MYLKTFTLVLVYLTKNSGLFTSNFSEWCSSFCMTGPLYAKLFQAEILAVTPQASVVPACAPTSKTEVLRIEQSSKMAKCLLCSSLWQ